MGLVVLFLVILYLVLPSKSVSKVEVCKNGHKWEWPDDGDLYCTECKRTAYEVMNGLEK